MSMSGMTEPLLMSKLYSQNHNRGSLWCWCIQIASCNVSPNEGIIVERTSLGNWLEIGVGILFVGVLLFLMHMLDSLWLNVVDHLSLVECAWNFVNFLVGGGVFMGII